MNFNKKISFRFLVSLLFSAILLSGCSSGESPLNLKIKKYGITIPGTQDMTLVRNFLQPAKGKIFQTIIAQNKDSRIEIEIISPMPQDEAASYAKTKYAIIKDLYGPKTIPYPAAITQLTGAPDNKKPIELQTNILGKITPVLIANASERYVLGVWEDELISQKCAFAVFYDPISQAAFQILVFFKADEFDEEQAMNILTGIDRIGSR